jgi:alkylhydroperoxidase family enzyme
MSFIQRELDRLSAAMREPCSTDIYDRLSTAQQALAWALEPTVIAELYTTITRREAGAEDCPSSSHQA